MKIGIASDHRGFLKKQEVTNYLHDKGYTILDYGTDGEETADYPTYAFRLGEAVRDNKVDLGILICGTGIGMSIACNKVKNVRCAKVNTIEEASLARKHNNANVVAVGTSCDILPLIETFVTTSFSEEDRHARRNKMVDEYDC